MKILLVDDDIVDRRVIRRALYGTQQNKELLEVESVKDAITALEQHSFDVILLDYRMPETDGIELLLHVRQQPNLGNTAVVMVSASEDERLALDCIAAGAQDFIPKSEVTPAKLKRAILHGRKRFEMEQALHHGYQTYKAMAEKDPLTGLSNRYHFEEMLKVLIANNRRQDAQVALMMLDLDNFKYVNDTFGHDAGDDLLLAVVTRIQEYLRDHEGFARLGGDEFAILLGNISGPSQVIRVGQRIVDALQEPFQVAGQQVNCGVSVGIALYPANAVEAKTLLKYADIAMYRAKQNGKNQLCFFEDEIHTEFNQRYKIEMALHQLVAEERFLLAFQPIFCCATEQMMSFETLIRWPEQSPHYTPDVFIPVAEQAGLIKPIGRWVIKAALEQFKQWRLYTTKNLALAINLSPKELANENLVDYIQTQLVANDIAPQQLTIEVTETAFFEQQAQIGETFAALKQLGCMIALDDFGTGYSSISHLMDYPIDIVKLDRSLFQQADNEKQQQVIKGMIIMLRSFDVQIIAEGVETQDHLRLCQALGVDKIQGYLKGKPTMAANVAEQWLN